MFVIADMEWMTNTEGHHSPAQMAALRVDEQWNIVAEFDAFIRPHDPSFYDWNHMAYTGGTARDFIGAKNAYLVLEDFRNWLRKDDVVLWWHAESQDLYEKLVELILKANNNHKSVAIWKHVGAFLAGQGAAKGNPYKRAKSCGVEVDDRLQHCSKSDVSVLRQLLAKIQYPQNNFLEPLSETSREKKPRLEHIDLSFRYDPETNTVHRQDCPHIAGKETHGYPNLKSPLRKGYKPCSCCEEEYRQALKERNVDILNRSQYTYIYTPDSPVFHKHTCGMMLHAKSILGTRKYETIAQTGRVPCRRCRPTPNDIARPLPAQHMVPRREVGGTVTMMPKGSEKALKRQKAAIAERHQKLKQEGLTETQRKDVFTLTQPRFVFWAAQGYQTFHTHSCSKLQGLSNLKGFSTYREAVCAGLTPCRKCRPTAKQDMRVSIPITNRVRKNETIEDLVALCQEWGYPYVKEEKRFYLETTVGKWKIHTNTSPIKLEHINLVSTPGETQYHEQPRLFLSFADVFDYIKRHDGNLTQRAEEGLVFLKFVAQT